MITAGEIANALGVSEKTVRRMRQRGDLPFLRLMGRGQTARLVCKRSEIEEYKQSLPKAIEVDSKG